MGLLDDARLMSVLLGAREALSARDVGRRAGVDPDYAELALARMADDPTPLPEGYPVLRRPDLGEDFYEAISGVGD